MLDGHQKNDPERAGIEEQYSSATHTSNLRIDTREGAPRSAADVMVAAMWSRSRIGLSLLRLHSEWDGAEKPPPPTPAQVEAMAKALPAEPAALDREVGYGPLPKPPRPNPHAGLVRCEDAKGCSTYRLPFDVAKEHARTWYLHELGMLFQKLKSLPSVRHQLLLWAIREEIDDGWWDEVFYTREEKIAHALSWWLDATCRTCEGQRWEMIPGTPHLSNRVCKTCGGRGKAPVPAGPDGRKILAHVKDCTAAARADMNRRFRHERPKE